MILTDKDINWPVQPNKTFSRSFSIIDHQDSSIDCRQKTLIVGRAGSGKSSFCQTYFRDDKGSTVFLDSDLGSSISSSPVLSIPNTDHDRSYWAIDLFRNSVVKVLGYWLRSKIARAKGGGVSISSDDTFLDILNVPISKSLLTDPTMATGFSTSGIEVTPDREWVKLRLSTSNLLPEEFTIQDVLNSQKEVVQELFEDSSGFRESLLSKHGPIRLEAVIFTLIAASFVNHEVGLTHVNLESIFKESDSEKKWSLKFNLVNEVHYGPNGQNTTTVSLQPYYSADAEVYSYADLSTTQRLEVYTVLTRSVVALLKADMSSIVFIFDEPDARIDPASLNYLLDLIDLYHDSKAVFVTTHNPALLSLCSKRVDFDILGFSRSESGTEIRKITNNGYAIRKVLNRLTGGINFISTHETISEGFLKSAPEANLIFMEGKTDVELMRTTQQQITDFKLFSDELREFLKNVVILNLFTDEAENEGAGSLAQVIKMVFPVEALDRQDKRIVAIFDSDSAGLAASSSIYQSYLHRPGPGVVVRYGNGRKLYANLHCPMSLPEGIFTGKAGPTIEHMLHHKKDELMLRFDALNGKFAGNNKTATNTKLLQHLNTCNKLQKEECLSEFQIIFESLRVAISQ